jgi:hypothetical protein
MFSFTRCGPHARENPAPPVHGLGPYNPSRLQPVFGAKNWRQAATTFPPTTPPAPPPLLPQPNPAKQTLSSGRALALALALRPEPQPQSLDPPPDPEGSRRLVRHGGLRWVLRGREGGAGGEHLPRVPQAVRRAPPPTPLPSLPFRSSTLGFPVARFV